MTEMRPTYDLPRDKVGCPNGHTWLAVVTAVGCDDGWVMLAQPQSCPLCLEPYDKVYARAMQPTDADGRPDRKAGR